MTVTVDERQCMMDVALQHCGDAEALFEMAIINNIGLTELVKASTDITVPAAYRPDVVKYYKEKDERPANDDDDTAPILEGIGYWIIGNDFIVS